MIERTTNRFNWWLPFYGALGAAIVCLPKMIFGNDIGTFLVAGIIAAVLCLILLVFFFLKIRRQTLPALAMVAAFLIVSWLLFHISDDVRTTGRWLISSKKYKAEVLAQPKSAINELKHVEWDGWGFAGSGNTTVYLVFDPNDSLSVAAKSRSPGKFSGIPCEVPDVRRLEDHWYTVLFYTDTSWNYCGE
jgi:cell division protein FtsW (lipid II flippase)